ncbi:unnamed protein product [Cladocopium goreaui]|uniref:PDZ domain-containing protein n=1 Tax=Cladocopium goreaui TaxID=2562237 RepID=A0A9P1GQ59_9DINO|nr:unnamed protein product [Cladocopium goreaui]
MVFSCFFYHGFLVGRNSHAMETWIKSKADQFAQAAHQQVNAVHQSASRLAEDVLQKVTHREDDDRRDLEFRDGPLGFTLEGNLVVAVQPNSQAERLGVAIGDRLVRVDGYEVPDVESGGFEEQRARALITKWLKDMPRPGVLTFELPEEFSDEGEPVEQDAPTSPEAQDEASATAKSTAVQVLQGELQRIQEERRKLSLELQESQEQRGALTAQLEQVKQKSDQQLRRSADLEEQLQVLRSQHKELKELHQALGSKEEASQAAAQASAARVETTQVAAQAAESRAAAAEQELSLLRQELKTALATLAETEAAATATRMQLEPLEKEMRGFGQAHEAELELLREDRGPLGTLKVCAKRVRRETYFSVTWQNRRAVPQEQQKRTEAHAQHVKELEQRLEVQQQQAAEELQRQQEELQRSKEALVEAQVTAEAAALEARAVRMEAASTHAEPNGDILDDQLLRVEEVAMPVAKANSGEVWTLVLGLQKRIDLLENRCASLQRPGGSWPSREREIESLEDSRALSALRLQSQESVMSTAPLRPSWELKLAAVAGPYVTAVVVTIHRLALGMLRGFLEKLLKSEAWLWVFYAHLLVLYAIAASSSLQTTADAGRGAVDSLNAQLASAGAGGPGYTLSFEVGTWMCIQKKQNIR